MDHHPSHVSFVWRSPLHLMSEPDIVHPYEILSFSEENTTSGTNTLGKRSISNDEPFESNVSCLHRHINTNEVDESFSETDDLYGNDHSFLLQTAANDVCNEASSLQPKNSTPQFEPPVTNGNESCQSPVITMSKQTDVVNPCIEERSVGITRGTSEVEMYSQGKQNTVNNSKSYDKSIIAEDIYPNEVNSHDILPNISDNSISFPEKQNNADMSIEITSSAQHFHTSLSIPQITRSHDIRNEMKSPKIKTEQMSTLTGKVFQNFSCESSDDDSNESDQEHLSFSNFPNNTESTKPKSYRKNIHAHPKLATHKKDTKAPKLKAPTSTKTRGEDVKFEAIDVKEAPNTECPFLIKHYLFANRNENLYCNKTVCELKDQLKSRSPKSDLETMYKNKCIELEQKYGRYNSEEEINLKPPKQSDQYRHYSSDKHFLSFEETAEQPWFVDEDSYREMEYPSSDSNGRYTRSSPEMDFTCSSHGNMADSQNSLGTVYSTCGHHQHNRSSTYLPAEAVHSCSHGHQQHNHSATYLPADAVQTCSHGKVHMCSHGHRHVTYRTCEHIKSPSIRDLHSTRGEHGINIDRSQDNWSRSRTTSSDQHDAAKCDCHSCMIREHLTLLTQYMEAQGYEVKNVSGDGNCLFTAVVDQLRINGDFRFANDTLRQKTVELLRTRPMIDEETHMSAFLTNETWDEYLSRMALDGEWGDDIMLKGISELTGRKIVVFSSSQLKTTLTPTNISEKEELYIGHIRSLMHFVSLRPVFWERFWPGCAKMRKLRSMIEESETSSALALSWRDFMTQKMEMVGEFMRQGDFDNARKALCEMDQLKDNNDFFTITSDNIRDATRSLVENKFGIDRKSGVSMLHLSFILKFLITHDSFQTSNEDKNSYMSLFDIDEHTINIGMNELGLDVSLFDYTNAMRHFDLIKKKKSKKKEKQFTFVRMPPDETYTIIEEDKYELNSSERVLKIVTERTFPGYLRLVPKSPLQWPNCVELLALNESYIHTLNVGSIPDSLVPEVHMKQFQGLRCQIWPKEAEHFQEKKSTSGWPSPVIIQEAMNKGCVLIKRSHKLSERPSIEWRFVFNDAEKVLASSLTDDMKYGFYIFCELVEFHTRSLTLKIKPYYLLTVLFHCCEDIPVEAWSSNVGGSVMYLIDRLLQHINDHHLPNYFIAENNMFEHIDDNEIKNWEYYIDALRWFPFASVYFLLESRSFLNLSMMDKIETSMDEYRLTKDAHKTVNDIFVPLCFKMASQNIKHNYIAFFKSALYYLDLALQQTSCVSDERLSFEDLAHSFLSTIGKKNKLLFCQFVDKEKKTNLCQNQLRGKDVLPISAILGPEYKGPWENVIVDASVDEKWNSIYKLVGHIFEDDLNDCIEMTRCSISALQQELKWCKTEKTEYSDETMKKQQQRAKHQQIYVILSSLVTFYKYLATCYEESNQIEMFQEHIHDYEEIASRIDSSWHFSNLARLYGQLGNREKAEEMKNRTKDMDNNEQSRTALLLFIR